MRISIFFLKTLFLFEFEDLCVFSEDLKTYFLFGFEDLRVFAVSFQHEGACINVKCIRKLMKIKKNLVEPIDAVKPSD